MFHSQAHINDHLRSPTASSPTDAQSSPTDAQSSPTEAQSFHQLFQNETWFSITENVITVFDTKFLTLEVVKNCACPLQLWSLLSRTWWKNDYAKFRFDDEANLPLDFDLRMHTTIVLYNQIRQNFYNGTKCFPVNMTLSIRFQMFSSFKRRCSRALSTQKNRLSQQFTQQLQFHRAQISQQQQPLFLQDNLQQVFGCPNIGETSTREDVRNALNVPKSWTFDNSTQSLVDTSAFLSNDHGYLNAKVHVFHAPLTVPLSSTASLETVHSLPAFFQVFKTANIEQENIGSANNEVAGTPSNTVMYPRNSKFLQRHKTDQQEKQDFPLQMEEIQKISSMDQQDEQNLSLQSKEIQKISLMNQQDEQEQTLHQEQQINRKRSADKEDIHPSKRVQQKPLPTYDKFSPAHCPYCKKLFSYTCNAKIHFTLRNVGTKKLIACKKRNGKLQLDPIICKADCSICKSFPNSPLC